jgi:TfoX/Sxy family transcriptional regulator of competence genes
MTRRGVGGKTARAPGVGPLIAKPCFMSYSEKLADRIREALVEVPKVKEKVMFSGVTFMVDDKMCISVGPDRIMCRIDPVLQDQLLEEKPCRVMVMKGREYKGYIVVNEEDVQRKKELDFWIGLCLDFNARAKSSKKKAAAPVKGKAAAPSKKKKPVANKKK